MCMIMLHMLRASCRAFGAKVVPANTVLKALPPLFESKDAKARDKVKEIVVGCRALCNASNALASLQ